MKQNHNFNQDSQAKRSGRPPKKTEQIRCHKVTIALTESEYQHFKKLAGHEPLPTPIGRNARPKRRHGSMAGLIRRLMKMNGLGKGLSPLATVEQEKILGQIANQSNYLQQLRQQADAAGFLAVVVQLTNLIQRLNSILDEYDRIRRTDRKSGSTINLAI